jgi:hypothetical protein
MFERAVIRPTSTVRGQRARGVRADIGYAKTVTHDTFTCGHCSRVVPVPHAAAWLFRPRQVEDIGGYCEKCGRMCCLACSEKQTCAPLMKRLDVFLTTAGNEKSESFLGRLLKQLRL